MENIALKFNDNFLVVFATDLTSGGGMGLKNGGCQDSNIEQFFYSEFEESH